MLDRSDWGLVPDCDLREMAQGCSELTCLYHGAINAELRRRTAPPTPTTDPRADVVRGRVGGEA